MSPKARKYLDDNCTYAERPILAPIRLRCDIAARAMQAMIASKDPGVDWPLPEEVAKLSIVYADWLLEYLAK